MFKLATIIWLSLCILVACNSASDNDSSAINNSQLIRSISLAPHLTELIYSAGGQNNLIGVSAFSNYPPDALNKQIIGDAFHLNLELISELNPDVIFYWHNGTPAQTIEQLKSLGFKLQNIDITDLSDIPKAIQQIAETLKTQPNEDTRAFLPQLKQLKQQAKNQIRLSALIQISDQPIFTVNGNHWMSEAIETCGLINVFADLPNLSAAVTLESVILKKPDVIIRMEPLMAENQLSAWTIIPAIEKQNIVVLEADHFTRPTLRTLSAIRSLCQQMKNH